MAQSFDINTLKKNFYFKVNLGYDNGLGINTIGHYYAVDDYFYGYVSQKKNGSYGNGITGGLSFGYFLNKYFAIELNASLNSLNAPKIDFLYQGNNYSSERKFSETGSQFRLSPVLVGILPINNFTPYIKVGLLIPLISTLNGKEEYSTSQVNPPTEPYIKEYHVNSSISPGFTGSFGANIYINKHVGLFGEIILNLLSQDRTKSTLSSYIENGTEKLSTLKISQKEIDYSGNSSNNNSNSPLQVPTQSIPISSIGIKVGLIYILTK